MEVEHKDLSFHQLMNDMVLKILLETPTDQLSVELSNKLSFMQFLIEMSFKKMSSTLPSRL